MNIKKFVLGITSVILSSFVFSQTDSTDITIAFLDHPTIPSSEDPLSILPIDFNELILQFDISDTLNTESVYLELVQESNQHVVAKHSYTLEELRIGGFLNNQHVNLSVGFFEKNTSYTLYLILKNFEGVQIIDLTKSI